MGPLVIGMQDGFEISANWASGRVVRWVKRARYPKHDLLLVDVNLGKSGVVTRVHKLNIVSAKLAELPLNGYSQTFFKTTLMKLSLEYAESFGMADSRPLRPRPLPKLG